MVSLPNRLPPPPFMPSPSPGPGQALSNRERPPHRPVFPHPVPPLRSSPACPSACLSLPREPVLSPAEGACPEPAEGNAPLPSPAPKLRQPAPQKIRQISRPPARLPLWGSRAGGREYPTNPHRQPPPPTPAMPVARIQSCPGLHRPAAKKARIPASAESLP